MSPEEPPSVDRVLVVSKTHMDVGFTDTAAAVRRRYLDEFLPRAVATARELRRRGGPARLRWTTGAWILTEALEAAAPSWRRELEDAVERGDLCWHALPFTLHTELCPRPLLEHAMTLSAELDRRFGRRTTAAKATDVPGHTRGLVSVLAEAGVGFLHVGVNPAATVPSVPEQFRWRDDAAPGSPEILVMYQPGGYGAAQVVARSSTVLVVDLTGDNVGPRSVAGVEELFAGLSRRWPGARVVAATLDDAAQAMAAGREHLPVVTAEIGDAWIHGTGSAPRAVAGFRALARLRGEWAARDPEVVHDPGVRRASTTLVQVAEHTWGLDQKTHWPERGHWGVHELAEVRDRADTVRFEGSWTEQQDLLRRAVDELGATSTHRGALAAARLADALDPPGADELLAGLAPCDPTDRLRIGGWTLRFDPGEGSVVDLVDPSGVQRASVDRPVGRYHQQTFDAADYERWFATFNAPTRPEDVEWARWDNTKPGLEDSGARSARWPTRLVAVHHGTVDGREVAAAELRVVAGARDPVAVPARLVLALAATADGQDGGDDALEMTLLRHDLPAARWPTASWWSVGPLVADPSEWRMTKAGEPVDPLDVVDDAGHRLHSVEELVHPEARVTPLDTGLVAPGSPDALRWERGPVDLRGGWHLCVSANLWGTNFPMWIEGTDRFRVLVAPTSG